MKRMSWSARSMALASVLAAGCVTVPLDDGSGADSSDTSADDGSTGDDKRDTYVPLDTASKADKETDQGANDSGAAGNDSGDDGPVVVDTSGGSGCPAGQVLDCTGVDCDPASWLGDGVCDSYFDLDCAATNWDGGDCTPGGTGGTGGGGGSTTPLNPCPVGQLPDCNGTCADLALIQNSACDAAFDCPEYGNDAGACGVYNACDVGDVPDCGTTGQMSYNCSPASWLLDNYCDSWLNCETFGWDASDCP